MIRMTDEQFRKLMECFENIETQSAVRISQLEARVAVLERAAVLNNPNPPGMPLRPSEPYDWHRDPWPGNRVTD